MRSIILPDDRVGWLPFALWAGWRLCQRPETRPTVLLSSSFPHTAHLVGYILHRMTGVPWVADFRDGWTQNPYFGPPPRGIRHGIQHWLEKLVVRRAQGVIAVSEPIVRHLQSLRREGSPVLLLPNGFDPKDYPAEGSVSVRPGTIVYTGTLFGKRSPEGFFRAVAAVLQTKQDAALRLVFQTQLEPAYWDFAKELGIAQRLELLPMGSHSSALALQQQGDLLLLLEPDGPGAEIMMTQKVFEYLGSGRPILAMVPEGACRELLKKTGGAWLTDPAGVKEAAGYLANWLDGERPPPVRVEEVAIYRRDKQAAVLGDFLNRIVSLSEDSKGKK
jgi:glycosyltransferase involved in cell wall biosynthesis